MANAKPRSKRAQAAKRRHAEPGQRATPAPRGRGRPPAAAATKADRRAAILAAALAVFAEHGFEAARLDEVATRAGVAKGTLYLYFADKQALFEAIVRTAVSPVIARLEQMARLPDVPLPALIDGLYALFVAEVIETDRKLVVRLILSEGPRFPAIARFYYDEVVGRAIGLLRTIATRAHARGELADDTLTRFPQLIVAPAILAVLWDGLFASIAPLDARGLLQAQRQALVPDQPRSRAARSRTP